MERANFLSIFLTLGIICVVTATPLSLRDTAADYPEKNYYELVSDSTDDEPPARGGGRPGSATNSHSCGSVRRVPRELRLRTHMYPNGLGNFYQKYTEAYGIPILGSDYLPDSALKRACYVVRFLLADNYAVRNSYYKKYGRFALMGRNEVTTNIPEHANLGSFWDTRARGLGATPDRPVSTAAEENALCYSSDRYRQEDIVLHEYAHGAHLLGAYFAVANFDNRLRSLYNSARSRGLWANTYALSTDREYFAEGVQSYFNAEAYSNPPNGIHNHVNTREKLRGYDPGLYQLIREFFPCNNDYIDRCENDRAAEQNQVLEMNCVNGGGSGGGGGGGGGESECTDDNQHCSYWANNNYCTTSREYMEENCKKSCNVCNNTDGGNGGGGEGGGGESECTDDNQYCDAWARTGYCTSYRDYMEQNCRKSCDFCTDTDGGDGGGATGCRDNNQSCNYWAGIGECDKNPGYMRENCRQSCGLC